MLAAERPGARAPPLPGRGATVSPGASIRAGLAASPDCANHESALAAFLLSTVDI